MTHAMQSASSSQLQIKNVLREFSKVEPHRFLPIISDTQNQVLCSRQISVGDSAHQVELSLQ